MLIVARPLLVRRAGRRSGAVGRGRCAEAQLPLEDEEELEMLDTLVESLHGERLTRVLVEREDADFLARRTLVRWLYLTQPPLGLF